MHHLAYSIVSVLFGICSLVDNVKASTSSFCESKFDTIGIPITYEIIRPGYSWSDIVDLKFINDSVGFVLSRNNKISRTQDHGQTWTDTSISSTVRKIHFLSDSRGYVVTDKEIYETQDTGLSWNLILNDNQYFLPSAASKNHLYLVRLSDYKIIQFNPLTLKQDILNIDVTGRISDILLSEDEKYLYFTTFKLHGDFYIYDLENDTLEEFENSVHSNFELFQELEKNEKGDMFIGSSGNVGADGNYGFIYRFNFHDSILTHQLEGIYGLDGGFYAIQFLGNIGWAAGGDATWIKTSQIYFSTDFGLTWQRCLMPLMPLWRSIQISNTGVWVSGIFFGQEKLIFIPHFYDIQTSVRKDDIYSEIRLYPNPTSEFVQIEAMNSIQDVFLFDIQGRLIKSLINVDLQTVKIPIGGLSGGMYIAQIKTNDRILVKSFYKK